MWNPSTSQWSTTAGSRTVIVQVLDFSADANAWSNGAWCAGRLVAHVESLVDGSGADRLDFDFYAPILTPSFPH